MSHTLLTTKYQEFKDLIDKGKGASILQVGKDPPWEPIYNLALSKHKVLQEYIEENLVNGFTSYSTCPTSAQIFFVKKEDRLLRLVLDYQGLSIVTIQNQYVLRPISNIAKSFKWSQILHKP